MFLSQYLTTPAAPHISVEEGYFLPLPKDLVRKGNIFTQSSSLELSLFLQIKIVFYFVARVVNICAVLPDQLFVIVRKNNLKYKYTLFRLVFLGIKKDQRVSSKAICYLL